LRTFGDGCPEVFVIQAFMQFSHFGGYRSNNFFNSMRWAEDTSPKVRKSRNVGTNTHCYRAERFIFSGNYREVLL
jgi:hypothetical protein